MLVSGRVYSWEILFTNPHSKLPTPTLEFGKGEHHLSVVQHQKPGSPMFTLYILTLPKLNECHMKSYNFKRKNCLPTIFFCQGYSLAFEVSYISGNGVALMICYRILILHHFTNLPSHHYDHLELCC